MFIEEPPLTPDVRSLFEDDVREYGYVAHTTRLWAWRPDIFDAFKQMRAATGSGMSLSQREFAVLIAATVAQHGDAYCSLAWGSALADEASERTAVGVLAGDAPPELSAREAALAFWARRVTADAASTTPEDVDVLRVAGFSDRDIFEVTAIIAFRIAYSTVRTALGAQPDLQLAIMAPDGVRRAIRYGRPVDSAPSRTHIDD